MHVTRRNTPRPVAPMLGLAALAALGLAVPPRAARAQQSFYVTNYHGGANNQGAVTTVSVNGSSAATLQTINDPNDPIGLALDSSGNVYVGDAFTSTISEYTPASGLVRTFGSSATIFNPGQIAFDAGGNLYVTSFNNDSVAVFNSSGVYTRSITGAALNDPVGLAIDAQGNVYVGNANAPTIAEFSGNGAYIKTISDPSLSYSSSLAFDGAGNLYVADYGTFSGGSTVYGTTVSVFSSGGTFVKTIGNSGMVAPDGLAFDGAGNLYVASAVNSTISEFGGDGTFLRAISGPGINTPHEIAFAAAPEPSQTAALGVGLLGLGALALRARRRRA